VKKVLVTGASGFVGSHICDALHDAGYEVHALVRETSSLDWLDNDWVKIHVADLDHREALTEILKGKFAVVHAAAALHGAPERVLQRVNVDYTRLLAELAAKARVKKFIFISSNAAAGPGKSLHPKQEAVDDSPVSPYGKSKKRAEKALEAFHRKINVINLRFVQIYGPRDKHFMRMFKLLQFPIVPLMGKHPIYVPLVHVRDCAQAAVKTIESRVASGSTYYITDGMPYTFESMYDMMADALGRKLRFFRVPIWLASIIMGLITLGRSENIAFTPEVVRKFKKRYRMIIPSKARQELGWSPEVMAWDGFSETVEWYRSQGWL
jgi:nucleoside-diphosphate-sugar epimerase